MEYLTIKQTAEKWNLTTRWVQILCATGKIEGVVKFGRAWLFLQMQRNLKIQE